MLAPYARYGEARMAGRRESLRDGGGTVPRASAALATVATRPEIADLLESDSEGGSAREV